MNGIKASLQSLIATFHTYDYVFFGASATLFLLFIILAIVLHEKVILSLILILLSFFILVGGPIFGYNYVHSTLYKVKIENLSIKRLEFSEAVVIKGQLINQGKRTFTQCKISSKAYRGATNFLEEIVLPLKPFLKRSIVKEENIDVNQSVDFKMILEPFTYSKEYNISVKASCLWVPTLLFGIGLP